MEMNGSYIYFAFLFFFLAACNSKTESVKSEMSDTPEQSEHAERSEHHDSDDHHGSHEHSIEAIKIENLLRESLELAENIEVIMSYVEVPDSTTLPFHYHPGEEFAYIIEGSGELLLKDSTRVAMKAGDSGKVSLKQVHTFSTLDEGAKMVVFRVHEKGQPDRILVD